MSADTTGRAAQTETGILPLLVAFLGAPIVWALHLAASYFLVTLDCESDWDGAPTGVLVVTVLCAVAAWGAGWVGWREWRRVRGRADADSLDPPHVRQFLLLSGVVLAVLFAAAIIMTGIAPLFLPICE